MLRRAPKEIQDGIVLERRGVRDVDDDVRSGQYLLEALACEAVNPGRWRSRHDILSAQLELGCKLTTDEAGPAYDYDFHFWSPRNELALARVILAGVEPIGVAKYRGQRTD